MDTSAAQRGTTRPPASGGGGWYGWIAFAGTMLLMLGMFHAIAGLVAVFRDEYFLVGRSGLVVTADFTTWGWVHLILGVVLTAAGAALFNGATWARAVAVLVALTSSLVNLTFLSAYPLWSAIMIGLDVMVIYAVTTHGTAADIERY
jgi:hypothetical protein